MLKGEGHSRNGVFSIANKKDNAKLSYRFETDVVLNVLPCAQRNLHGRTHDAGSVKRISFRY